MKPKPPSKPVAVAEVTLSIPIAAPLARVWEALVGETALWWPRSFYTSERTQRFVIEPRLGGRAYEDAGNGEGLQWYEVIGVESPHSLLLSGWLAPPFAGPGASLLRLTLTADGKNGTLLEVSESAFGHVAGCAAEEGWQEVFGGLKTHAEKPATARRKSRAPGS